MTARKSEFCCEIVVHNLWLLFYNQNFRKTQFHILLINSENDCKNKRPFFLIEIFSPPSFRFLTEMWHPNIYENGDVCISILHPPIDDPQSGELPSERWNPTQNVRTVLLSVISLLNEPNTFSPGKANSEWLIVYYSYLLANVDASVMYRRWKESDGKDEEYKTIIIRQVKKSQEDAKKDNVTSKQ